MAVGVACAGSGMRAAMDLLEPLLGDAVDFVRQGALIASALVLMQQPEAKARAPLACASIRTLASASSPLPTCGAGVWRCCTLAFKAQLSRHPAWLSLVCRLTYAMWWRQ